MGILRFQHRHFFFSKFSRAIPSVVCFQNHHKISLYPFFPSLVFKTHPHSFSSTLRALRNVRSRRSLFRRNSIGHSSSSLRERLALAQFPSSTRINHKTVCRFRQDGRESTFVFPGPGAINPFLPPPSPE